MRRGQRDGSYKWIALSNTTLGMLMATINSSIVLISLPAIFNGIKLDPLLPANSGFLLWLLMGYMIVTAVLVVSFGRIGDMYGRVRMYNLGFAVFTVASIGLSVVFGTGPSAAMELIGLRAVQGIGGALLMANSVAILTDAFPQNERGLALGINGVAMLAGSFIGLIMGGLLSAVDWHLVFLVSVPFGLFGTVWAYLKLRETGSTKRARIDWLGNVTFACGLVAMLAGINAGIQPYRGAPMSWGNPLIEALIGGGAVLLALFAFIETRVPDPMFRLELFRNRAFTAGNIAGFLAAVGRGGLMFILIIWLQGIWLPLHGYAFTATPLWAAIYMLPQTLGFMVAGPISGYLSDRFGARRFATAGMIFAALSYGLFLLLPADFTYVWFALIILLNGLAMGLFSSPNVAAIMNAVPANQRGAASGMRAALQNTGMTFSIGIFFSLIIIGLASSLPRALVTGLRTLGISAAVAHRVASLPPVGSIFAAFLGYNPMQAMLHGVALTRAQSASILGRSFFPHAISGPFMHGMHLTFVFSAAIMAIAAAASHLRGKVTASAVQAGQNRVVTFSSSIGSGGGSIARAVARELDLGFVDRLIPFAAAEHFETPPDEAGIQHLLGLMSSLQALYGVSAPNASGNAGEYRERIEEGVCDAARRGCVVVGRGAAIVLRDWPHALRVRVDGPFEKRVERVMQIENVDRRVAERRTRRSDAAQAVYLREMYGRDIRDPDLYDVVLDGTSMPQSLCVGLVVQAARKRFAQSETGSVVYGRS